ncbi:MAG: long-chain fatty acid--CoA ligase [Polyangia bacterium]|jgi:long-chain acyl-CoA synthetase
MTQSHDTGVDNSGVPGDTIAEMYANRALATPNAPAYMTRRNGDWQTLTWQQAYEKSSDIAHGLLAIGAKLGDKIALMGSTREEWTLCDLGLVLAGGITVPIYPSSLKDTVSYILKDSESSIIFIEDKKQLDKLLSIRAEIPHVKQVILWDGHAENDPKVDEWVVPLRELCDRGRAHRLTQPQALPELRKQMSANTIATIIYTSGTTGNPKGVVQSHASFCVGSRYGVTALPVRRIDRQLLFLPLAHSFAKTLSMVAVHVGFCTAYSGIDTILEYVGQVKPSFMAGVPRIYEKVYAGFLSKAKQGGAVKWALVQWAIEVGVKASREIQAGRQPSGLLAVQWKLADKLVFSKLRERFGGKLKWFVSGSAPLSRELAEFFHAAGMLILEGYGLTETNSFTSVNRIDAYKFGTVGKPLHPELKVKIASDGEILTRGVTNLTGYYKLPDATAEAIDADGWFHTGDIGEIDSDGFIKITDRKKDLIKTSGGKYVAPQMIENQLKLDPIISQAVVIGDNRKYITALVAINQDIAKQTVTDGGQTPPSDVKELGSHPLVAARIDAKKKEVNSKLGSWEQVKYIKVLPRELTEQDGELTPSMKVKRKVVIERYRDTIESMYQGKEKGDKD